MIINGRKGGILFHITSLPSPYGTGDLGPAAFEFADFLVRAKQSYWQILPLSPTDPAMGNSPYSSFSAFAGNVILISPEILKSEGWIDSLPPPPEEAGADYEGAARLRAPLFEEAFRKLRSGRARREVEKFREDNRDWIQDYALFAALKRKFGGSVWNSWPEPLRDRDQGALRQAREELKYQIIREEFLQYIFFSQWRRLKEKCNSSGVKIIGDLPFYVNYDSADVWAHSGIFKLDGKRRPLVSAGVPPDYFSSTGQLWGNPVYSWKHLEERGYPWWRERMEQSFKRYDLVRLDHFRGFSAYWEVPCSESDARKGCWQETPGRDFFTALARKLGSLPAIAEDLGYITDDVRKLMKDFGFPGMKVLLFAFGDDFPGGSYLPEKHEKNSVVYTGTHDNDTVRGWFENDMTANEKKNLETYLRRPVTKDAVSREFVEMALKSPAALAVLPIQDVLGLGREARMNVPSLARGNWTWRLSRSQLTALPADPLSMLMRSSGRS